MADRWGSVGELVGYIGITRRVDSDGPGLVAALRPLPPGTPHSDGPDEVASTVQFLNEDVPTAIAGQIERSGTWVEIDVAV